MSLLDQTWDEYLLMQDAFRVTRKGVGVRFKGLIESKHERLFDRDALEVVPQLETAEKQYNHLTVMRLVALFERLLRNAVLGQLGNCGLTNVALREHCKSESEYWSFADDLIDLFSNVHSQLRGQAKQLVRFRDWVAHGRGLLELPPTNCTPFFAYEIIKKFLDEAQISPTT